MWLLQDSLQLSAALGTWRASHPLRQQGPQLLRQARLAPRARSSSLPAPSATAPSLWCSRPTRECRVVTELLVPVGVLAGEGGAKDL
jgi:hypothetical protein